MQSLITGMHLNHSKPIKRNEKKNTKTFAKMQGDAKITSPANSNNKKRANSRFTEKKKKYKECVSHSFFKKKKKKEIKIKNNPTHKKTHKKKRKTMHPLSQTKKKANKETPTCFSVSTPKVGRGESVTPILPSISISHSYNKHYCNA